MTGERESLFPARPGDLNERPPVYAIVRFLGDPSGYRVPRWITNCRLSGWTVAERGRSGERVRINLDQAYLIEAERDA